MYFIKDDFSDKIILRERHTHTVRACERDRDRDRETERQRERYRSAQIWLILRTSFRNLGSSPFQLFQPVGLADLVELTSVKTALGRIGEHHKETGVPRHSNLGPQPGEALKGRLAVQMS